MSKQGKFLTAQCVFASIVFVIAIALVILKIQGFTIPTTTAWITKIALIVLTGIIVSLNAGVIIEGNKELIKLREAQEKQEKERNNK